MYPEWISKLPQIKTPFPGAAGWLITSSHGQVVFWEFPHGAEVSPHRHGPQMGFVLEGRTVMEIDGQTQVCVAGETFMIGDQVEHSAVVDPGTFIVEFYQESDRHTAHERTTSPFSKGVEHEQPRARREALEGHELPDSLW